MFCAKADIFGGNRIIYLTEQHSFIAVCFVLGLGLDIHGDWLVIVVVCSIEGGQDASARPTFLTLLRILLKPIVCIQ